MNVSPLNIKTSQDFILKSKDDAPPQNNDNNGQATLKEILDSSVLNSIMQKNLKSGETISISADGKEIISIKKESKSTVQRLREFGAMAVEEASQIIRQDPAFAFKTSAMLAKEQVLVGIPSSIAPIVEQAFLPTIRFVSLILDSKRLKEVFKSSRANKPDKIVSAAHVVTDVVGLAGAAMTMIPGVAQVGTYLAVAGLMGDIGAFGYNIMRYFENRGQPVPEPQNQAPAAEKK